MSVQYEEANYDFDLDFLNPGSNISAISDKTEKPEKSRKAILIVKKKIVATDSLIRRYYDKREEVEQFEKALQTSKEECKQTCLEFKNIAEKYHLIQKEIGTLRLTNVELQEKFNKSEDLFRASQSNANQLQILVKEKEKTIDSLKLENQLFKANSKDHEKTVVNLQHEKEDLIKDICLMRDIILGKKKLNKRSKSILKKYEKHEVSEDDGTVLDDDSDADLENDCDLLLTKILISPTKNTTANDLCSSAKDDNGHDSDFSNGLASGDTGRGSSLASSDGEKCFNSPDYFLNHSPLNTHNDIEKINYVDTALPIKSSKDPVANTSQVSKSETIQIVLSPIDTDNQIEPERNDEADLNMSSIFANEYGHTETGTGSCDNDKNVKSKTCNETSIIINKTRTGALKSIFDVSDTPEDISNDIATSPAIFGTSERTSGVKRKSNEALNEKEYLESNIISNYDETSTGDCEVEMILSKMRFNRTLITPIPSTPSKSRNASVLRDKGSKISHSREHDVCKDAAQAREENKILLEKFIKMEQELVAIKEILRNKFEFDVIRPSIPSLDEKLNKNSQQRKTKHKQKPANVKETTLFNTPKPSTKVTGCISKFSVPYCVSRELTENNSLETNTNIAEKYSVPSISFGSLVQPISDNAALHTKSHENYEFDEWQMLSTSHCSSIQEIPENDASVIEDHKNGNKTYESSRSQLSHLSPTQENNTNSVVTPLELPISHHLPIQGIPKNDTLRNKFNKNTNIVDEPRVPRILNYSPTNELPGDKTQIEYYENTNSVNKSRVALNELSSSMTDTQEHNVLDIECVENINTLGESSLPLNSHASPIQQCQQKEELQTAYHKHIITFEDDNNFVDSNKPEDNMICHKTQENINNNVAHSHKQQYRKLSKLDKLRKNLVPKSKIKSSTPINKKCIKPKVLQKKVAIESDAAAILNNKDAYDKAVQIMSEIKSQQKLAKTKDNSGTKSAANVITEHKDTPKSPNQCKKELVVAIVKCDENSNCTATMSPPKNQISTRSRNKNNDEVDSKDKLDSPGNTLSNNMIVEKILSPRKNIVDEIQHATRKRQKSESVDNQDVPSKRILRSSNLRQSTLEDRFDNSTNCSPEKLKPKDKFIAPPVAPPSNNEDLLSYGDLDLFNNDRSTSGKLADQNKTSSLNNNEIIFCAMLEKYGKQSRKNHPKKVSDAVVTSIVKTLQDEIIAITELNSIEAKYSMNVLVDTIRGWDFKEFMSAFIIYLQDPQRKVELFNKIYSPPAPPMTKSEQILLYVISQLKVCWSSFDILDCILCNIEYVLFKLNRTPEFETIESMAHFYAVLCRYFKMKSRLRLFMLDAMYCIQFKAVPLIKQCLDVWMHVLPLAHMGIAKSPLVTCLVYLLHFYKCEDRFNRVQEIRNILSRKYFYEITEWNEPKIIEMFRNAIKDIRAIPVEIKLLKIALIVISKRHGPKWCQKNIIKNLLLPMLEGEVPERVKIFCVSMLGPLLKPYPVDMKVHCEIVINLLLDTMKRNPSLQMEEAIISSLIYMSKHNLPRLLQTLLTWKPQKVSPEIEIVLRDFVVEKPLKVWKSILGKIQVA